MLASQLFAEIQFFFTATLVAPIVYSFWAHDPFKDALNARLHVFLDNGYTYFATTTEYTIFFWLEDYLPEVDWVLPPIYSFIIYTAIVYLFFKVFYIIVFPESTRHYTSIVLHHLITIVLLRSALFFHVEPCVSIFMLIEGNTFLLTIKNLQRYEPSDNLFSQITTRTAHFLYHFLEYIIDILFYLSWFTVRLVYYPYCTLAMYRFLSGGLFGYNQQIATALFVALCILNYHWSKGMLSSALLMFLGQVVIFFLCLM